MQTIIAATDFSPVSENAVYYAADMASTTGAKLILLHVFPLPVAFAEMPSPAYSLDQVKKDAEDDLEELKQKVTGYTMNRVQVTTALVQDTVVDGIKEYCETVNPYAVVIGSESKNAFERLLFGGNTVKAIHKISHPVIVVPPGTAFTALSKIGLACDFKDVVDTIPYNEIKNIVTQFKAELHVIHVPGNYAGALPAETIDEAEWLKNILHDLNPQYHILHDVNIEEGVMNFLDRNKLDLLIIITKKHSVFGKLFLPDHSKNLVLQVHIPVMSVHE